MSTLYNSQRVRRAALTLFSLVVAQLATTALAGVQVEVRGVDEQIRANVLAYLSFERYKNSDDLSREFIDRLQERTEREVRAALRPFGYYEPSVTSEVHTEGGNGEQNYRVVVTVTPGEPVTVDDVQVKVTGPGADDPVFTSITNDLPVQKNDRLSHSNYETLKGGLLRAAATFG
jgi:translocation and assembly module TamA